MTRHDPPKGSPVWIMKFLMTRWKITSLYVPLRECTLHGSHT